MDQFDAEIRDAVKAYARPSSACLGAEDFQAFYGDKLPAARNEQIRSHLASCASCLELARDYCVFAEADTAIEEKRSRILFEQFFKIAAGIVLVVALGISWTAYRNSGGNTTRGAESSLAPRIVAASGTTLEWEAVPGAVHYDVELQDPRFNIVWRQSRIEGTRATLPADVIKTLPPEIYGWRVFAVNGEGIRAPSAFASFEFKR